MSISSKDKYIHIGNDWDEAFKNLTPFVNLDELYSTIQSKYIEYPNQINPPLCKVFRAFEKTPLHKINVVILGQDPYPGHGVADGLAFSTGPQNKTPASLRNIYKELNLEYSKETPVWNDLGYLAEQGVFLFNTSLLSKDGQPLFFEDIEIFQRFSKSVISKINETHQGIVFILLGGKAQAFSSLITDKNHILCTSHPSPLSVHRGFLGSGIFKKANDILLNENRTSINWLPESMFPIIKG